MTPKSTPAPRSLRALLVLVGALGVAMCVDGPTGLDSRTPQPASFNFAPRWESSAHGALLALADEGLPLDRVRIVIVRPEHDTLKDTTVTMHAGDPPLALELNVTAILNESLDAVLQFKSGETVLFQGTAQVTAQPLSTTVAGAKPVEIVIVYVGPGAAATKVAVTPATGTYPANAAIQFAASALADNGTPFPNTPFVWSVSDATIGTISASGLFTPTGKLGDVVITAETPAKLKGTAAAKLVSPVTSIIVFSGDNQTAAVTQPLAQPLVVAVLGAGNVGVPGQTVTFAATDGGTVTPLTAVTDANGQAQTTLNLGTHIGAYNFTAASNGFTVGAKAGATLGAPAKMVLVGPATFSLTAGLPVTNASTVKILDAGDNPVPNATASMEVDFGTASTSLALTANANGVLALPESFATNAKTGVYTIIFSKAGLTGSPITMTVTVVPGAAVNLAVATNPPATPVSGTVWAPQPAVQLKDVAGNAVAQSGVVVTVAMTSGSGTLNGTLTATTNAAGLATFTGLSITGSAGSRTLTFTATGMASATATTSIISATASKLVFKVSPSTSAQNGVAFTVQPTIQLVDASNNPVAQAGVLVTASQVDLGGTMQVATDASGAAAFTNLKLTGALGAHSVGFSAPGDIASINASINVTVGSPAFLVAVGPAQAAGVGLAVASPQGVKVTDVTGNPVQGVAVSFTLGANSGSATPLLHVSTDVSGVAHVTTWTLGSVGPNTMVASIDGSTTIAAVTITATGTAGAGIPVRMISNGGIGQTGQVGTTLSVAPSVKVVDVNNTGVPGVVVAFTMSGGGSVPTAQVVTNADGVAATPWTLGALKGLNVLTATVMDTTATGVGFIGFTGTGTLHTASISGNPVVFNAIAAPGPAAHIIKQDISGSGLPPGFEVPAFITVTDAFGNGIPGIWVRFEVKTGVGLVGGTVNAVSTDSTQTLQSGGALALWILSSEMGVNRLLVTAVATGIPGNPVTFETSTSASGPALGRLAPKQAPTLPKKSPPIR